MQVQLSSERLRNPHRQTVSPPLDTRSHHQPPVSTLSILCEMKATRSSALTTDDANVRTFSQMENNKEIMTPDQAADYLQLNRETIYRYIREGKLVASRLGRSYRIPKRSLDLLMWSTSTIPGFTPREYTKEQIEQFIKDDQLTPDQQEIFDRFNTLPAKRVTHPALEEDRAQRRT